MSELVKDFIDGAALLASSGANVLEVTDKGILFEYSWYPNSGDKVKWTKVWRERTPGKTLLDEYEDFASELCTIRDMIEVDFRKPMA